MSFTEHPEIKEISQRLEKEMIEYIDRAGASYSKEDVATCMNLLSTYLKALDTCSSKEEVMKAVKKVVLELNALNEASEYEMIETDQREDIAEIINLSASLKGYNSQDEDLTEDWRDW